MAAPEGNKFAEGNDGGRPSDHTPEFLMKARDYLVYYKDEDEIIPTIEGLAVYTDTPRRTLYNWMEDEDKEEFRHIIERLLALQGKSLVNKGLSGEYNPTISKLILSKHNYIEKTENTNHVDIKEVDQKEKAKLDSILNGTKKPTTQQGSNADSPKRDNAATEILV